MLLGNRLTLLGRRFFYTVKDMMKLRDKNLVD